MFKKLKHRFIIINMSLLTFVFFSIFTVIYILTAISLNRDLSYNLERTLYSPSNKSFDMPKQLDPPVKPDAKDPSIKSIIVDLDNSGNIINIYSFLTIDEEIIKAAVKKANSYTKTSGNIKVNGFYYAYLKGITHNNNRIVFIDRAYAHNVLKNTLLILVLVGGIALIILFLISLYLANKTIKPIKEAFDKQKQFIADASHELKTPLTIIDTNLALIHANKNETVISQFKWLNFISNQTERMSSLINDMLSLAKMDTKEACIPFEEFNLSEALDGIILYFEALIYENELKLNTSIKEAINYYGDKKSFEQLISILLDNAVKNTPKNGSITVTLNKDKEKIKIVVNNTGEGISPQNIDKIFERFYRVDSSRSRENGGFGLGLAIAKSIVEQFNGKIYVKSNIGIDTSFIIEL